MLEIKYTDHNYRSLNEIGITQCYLCGNELEGDKSVDHIIPNKLFPKDSEKKPILFVHTRCNNNKSKEDEWFIRSTQLMASLNPRAFELLNAKLLNKALSQKENLKDKNIRDYKLAVSLLDKNRWGQKINGNSVLHFGEEYTQRTMKYMQQVCRGLYLRNVPDALVKLPVLSGVQFAASVTQGTYEQFAKSVRAFTQYVRPAGFFQDWGGVISYSGSCVDGDVNKGFIYVELYGEVGYLALFD